MLEVGIDLKLSRLAPAPASELRLQGLRGEVGHVADHTSDLQPAQRLGVVVVVAAVEVGIALDHLAADDVPGHSLHRYSRSRCHGDNGIHEIGIARGPHQHLHPAERSAGDGAQMGNAEPVEEESLRAHHVLDRRPWILRSVRLAGAWFDPRWRGGAVARAGDVRADDKVLAEIDALAVSDEAIPPSRALVVGIGVFSGRVGARRQGVADEDGVRFIGIQLAERLVPDRERRDRLPMRETEALLENKILRRSSD